MNISLGEIFHYHPHRLFVRPPIAERVAEAKDENLTVETIADEDSFLALGSVWNRLVEEARIDHPFLSHEWVRTWWSCFGAGNRLHVLVVRAGDRVIAIAPLMLTSARMYGLKVRKIGFIANIHTPRFDLIIGEQGSEAYRAIWDYLSNDDRLWDVLELIQVPFDSATLKELPLLASQNGDLSGIWHAEDCPCVDLAQGWSKLLKSLSHNHRSQMGKRLRRLQKIGEVRLEIISGGDNVQRLLEEGLAIEAAAWKAKSGTAILCRPELVRFYRQFADAAARLDILRLVFLTVGCKRIAFAYALFHKNKIYVLKSGYDPEYAPYSPYLLLCHLLFEEACKRGIAEYEFLGMGDAWKLRWAEKTKPQFWLYIMRRKFRTLLIHGVKFEVLPTLRRSRIYSLIRRRKLDISLGFFSLLQVSVV